MDVLRAARSADEKHAAAMKCNLGSGQGGDGRCGTSVAHLLVLTGTNRPCRAMYNAVLQASDASKASCTSAPAEACGGCAASLWKDSGRRMHGDDVLTRCG
jgi:hypothetical protein